MEKDIPDKLQQSRQYLEEMKHLLCDSCLLGKEEMLNCLIDLGKKFNIKPSVNNFEQSNLVQGCQSLVYINLNMTDEEDLVYSGFSDSLIINGFLSILFRSFNGLNCAQAKDLWKTMEDFVQQSGLPETFTPNRRMGLTYILNFAKSLYEKKC